jgi:hypothetical protein
MVTMIIIMVQILLWELNHSNLNQIKKNATRNSGILFNNNLFEFTLTTQNG